MRAIEGFFLFSCLTFSVNSVIAYLEILQPRSNVNGSVFDVEINISSGIRDSGYESNVKEKHQLKIVPYGSDKVYVSAKEVKVSARNGNMENPIDHFIDLPKVKSQDFILTNDGHVVFRKNEPQQNWSFLKTLAGFLIFDYNRFYRSQKGEKQNVTDSLPTVYGVCEVNNIEKVTETAATVEQFFKVSPQSCSDYESQFFSDSEYIWRISGLEINNYRKYNLVKAKNNHTLDTLTTSQKIFWTPFEGKSLTHFLQTSYKFVYVEETTLSLDDSDFDFSNEHKLTDNFTASSFWKKQSFLNLASMQDYSSESLVKVAKDVLKEIPNIWTTHSITAMGSDKPMAKELPRILSLLELLDSEQFYSLWTVLKNDTLNQDSQVLDNFYNLVSLTGTEGAVLFVQRLILNEGMSSNISERMLRKLSGNVRKPTMKIVEALKALSDAEVKGSLLTFTTILGLAAKEVEDSDDFNSIREKTQKNLMEKISKSTKNIRELRLYIQALGNLRIVGLLENEEVQNLINSSENDDVCLWFIMALEKSNKRLVNFNFMVKILEDTKRSSDLKAVALRIALNSLLTDDIEKLARIMDSSKNFELYNLFESSIRAMVKAKQLPESSLLWLRRRESKSRSFAFFFEGSRDYPMSFSTRGYLFFNDETWSLRQIHLEVYQNYNNQPVKMYTIFARWLNSYQLNNFATLMDIKEKLSYEFTLSKGDKILISDIGEFDLPTIVAHIMTINAEMGLAIFNVHAKDIGQHINLDYSFPTDTGRNAHVFFNIPWMLETHLASLENTDGSGVNIVASLNFTAQSVTGMHLYHPQLEALQGSRESSSFHLIRQLSFKVSPDTKAEYLFAMEFTDNLTPLFGFRVRKETLSFLSLIGSKEIADDKYVQFVKLGNSRYTKDLSLKHLDLGAKYHMQLSDYNAPQDAKDFPETLSDVWSRTPMSDFLKMSTGDYMMSVYSFLNWCFLAPSAYTYNFKETLEPCHVYPVKKYALGIIDDDRLKVLVDFRDKDDNTLVNYKFADHGAHIQFIRTAAGEDTWGACFSELLDETEESQYHINMGKIGKLSECPKDQFNLVISRRSKFSSEQINNHNNPRLSYSDCLHKSPYLEARNPTNNEKCLKAAATLRDMTINVKYWNAPKDVQKCVGDFWMWFVKHNYGILMENHHSLEVPGEISFKVSHPLTSTYLNLDVLFPGQKFSFKLKPRILMPKSTVFSDESSMYELFKPSPFCTIVASKDKVYSSRHILHEDISSVEYAKVGKVPVSVRKVSEDLLAVTIDYYGQEITVNPKGNTSEITLGADWMDKLKSGPGKVETLRVLDTLFFILESDDDDESFVVGYNRQSVMILGVNIGNSNAGLCFGQQADKPPNLNEDD